jgi:Amidases related to nicotinamidase
MNNLRINRDDALLVVVDCQKKMMPVIHDKDELTDNIVKFIKGAKILDLPIITVQEYTEALGETIEPIRRAICSNGSDPDDSFSPVDKDDFSAMGSGEFRQRLEESGKKTVILVGIQAHICLMLTALDLKDAGYNVFVISDCIGSLAKSDCKDAGQRMRYAGITLTSLDAALFEMAERSSSPAFKPLNKLVQK